jgi:hypothetical protein
MKVAKPIFSGHDMHLMFHRLDDSATHTHARLLLVTCSTGLSYLHREQEE